MKLPPIIHLFEVTAAFERSSSGLRGRRKTYLTILEMAWSANLKMVWHVLLRPLRPELDGQNPFQISNTNGFRQTLERSFKK
jgi:hypothetical protein